MVSLGDAVFGRRFFSFLHLTNSCCCVLSGISSNLLGKVFRLCTLVGLTKKSLTMGLGVDTLRCKSFLFISVLLLDGIKCCGQDTPAWHV